MLTLRVIPMRGNAGCSSDARMCGGRRGLWWFDRCTSDGRCKAIGHREAPGRDPAAMGSRIRCDFRQKARREAAPIARPGDIDVSFSKGHGRWIGWEANCNGYGANVRIGAGRLKLTRIVGTAVGCSPVLGREDSWLLQFFEADPKWRWRGTHLTLTSGRRVMELEESKD